MPAETTTSTPGCSSTAFLNPHGVATVWSMATRSRGCPFSLRNVAASPIRSTSRARMRGSVYVSPNTSAVSGRAAPTMRSGER